MKLAKDLLYDKENAHLDIARLSALMSVIGYMWMSGYYIIYKDIPSFDFLEWAAGWAALCGGNAAWIYARQRIEQQMEFTPLNPRNGGDSDRGFSYGGYYDAAYRRNPRGGWQDDGDTE